MPQIRVFQIPDANEAEKAVKNALDVGYRLIEMHRYQLG